MKHTPTEKHLIYLYLLHKCLTLEESHARQVAESWYGHRWPRPPYKDGDLWDRYVAYSETYHAGVRSIPTFVHNLIISSEMAKRFNLEGVAGFYIEGNLWRLNIDRSRAALLRPYRRPDGLIAGFLVFKHLNDKEPRLLTSRGLAGGSKAEPYYPERMAS